jgi:hypothetical protein
MVYVGFWLWGIVFGCLVGYDLAVFGMWRKQ